MSKELRLWKTSPLFVEFPKLCICHTFSDNFPSTFVTNIGDLHRVRPDFCLSIRATQFQRTQPTLDILGESMTGHISTESRDLHAPAETRVWQAVITKTIQEWISGPLRRKREAEEYLFRDEKDFPLVCQSAGLDVGLLRAQLMRLRPVALTLQKSMV